jgi:hypothetical protein
LRDSGVNPLGTPSIFISAYIGTVLIDKVFKFSGSALSDGFVLQEKIIKQNHKKEKNDFKIL